MSAPARLSQWLWRCSLPGLVLLLAGGCDGEPSPARDGGQDGGRLQDAGPEDGGPRADLGDGPAPRDLGPETPDAQGRDGAADAGPADAGPADAAVADTTMPDSGEADAGGTPLPDGGPDAAVHDGGGGPADGGLPDPTGCLGEGDLDDLLAAWPLGTVVKTAGRGFLATVPAPEGVLYVPVLRGTHRQMGCQYGFLVAEPLAATWETFVDNLVEGLVGEADLGMGPAELRALAESVLATFWELMLPSVPAEFQEELAGVADGQRLAGIPFSTVNVAGVLKFMTVLANISDSGSIQNLEDLVLFIQSGHSRQLDEYFQTNQALAEHRQHYRQRFAALLARLPRDARARAALRRIRVPGHSCSIASSWGESSLDGHLIGLRNLDWNQDTGIAALKAVAFWIPDAGVAHLTVGYLGFFGALSGMNAQGLITGEVGSTGVLERVQGTPWTLAHRELLLRADGIEPALALLTNTRDDGRSRPPTIGYNWLVGWGDPQGQGAAAQAAILETNGVFTTVHRQDPHGTPATQVYESDLAGAVTRIVTDLEDPFYANLEQDAVEIDASGNPKKFQVDGSGSFIVDGAGRLVPDPAGQPFPLGKPLTCALYRGDEALGHASRRWQTAAQGPQGGPDRLMRDSSSYNHRYSTLHGMLTAYRTGTAYAEDGVEEVPDNGGTPVPLGLEQGVRLAQAAAMDSNVYSVVYDATALRLRVAFEQGTGETWVRASESPYLPIDAGEVFRLLSPR
ncbi:MAG: hypothetical protein RBU45_07225 [Myxococcota bacterium]|nr:hypothetical protein [Myxococcota bacterium]